MKKIILFALLLLTAVCALADTYIIGTGTSTGSTNPFYGLYDYSWSKVIYTATELSTAGMSASAEISGLGFYVGNTPANYTMLDQRVYVRHTSLANYGTATDETGTGYPNNANFTQVFQGNLTYNGGGWHYLNFSTNFEWNGTDGLEFLFENWDADYVTGYPTFRYTSTSTNYMTVYKAQDNSFPAVAGTRSYNRSNITIVTPSTEPPNPAVLIYPANGGWMFLDGALSWSDGGGMPTGYDVYLDTMDGSTLVSDHQTGTTFDPELAEETTYYWKVVPYNANGSAADCPVWSFQTPSTTQLAESFDATAFPPVGWANPGTWSRSTTTPFYGAGTAYKSASTTPALLATPLLDIQAGETLDFYYRTSSTTGYGLMNIKYSADKVTWNQIGTTISMPTTTDWIHTSVNLNTLAGNNYFLAFEVFTSTSTSSIYVDHVFGPEFAAVAPGPATPTAPANNAVDVARYPNFTWTAPTTGGMPAGYRIYCDTNTDPTTLLGTVTSGTTLSWTSTTALNYATLYYWKVVAYNPSGEATGNTVFSFITMADPTIYTLPWMEDFGTTGATFPPTNWTRWSGVLADPSTLVANTSYWIQDNWCNDTTVTPVNWSARMNIYSTSRYGWIITPPVQMPGAGYQLEFDIALTDYASTNPITSDPNGTTGVDDKFIVLIGDGSSWSTANILRQYDNAGSPYVYNNVSNTGDHLVFPLDSYTGVKYIAFYGESTLSNADNDFFVDNVMIRLTPAGAPEHVTLVSPADGTVDLPPENVVLSWTPSLTGGLPAYYEVYVGEDPLDPGTDYYGEYMYTTTETNLDLSAQTDIDLGFSNTWYWAVLPYNSDNLAPDPNEPEFLIWDFTTAQDPTIVALPYEEYFDGVTAPALPYGWTGYVNSSSTSAYVRTYNSTTYAQSPPNSAYLTNSTDTAADLRLITPPIDASIPLNTIKLKFYARSSTAGYPLLVGSVSATDGSGVFTQLQSIALTATKTEYEVSFANYAGTDHYICFKHGLGGTSRSLYVDNVRLLQLLPVDLAATALAGPGILEAGNSYDFAVSLFNEGTTTVNSYSVRLMSGETVLATLPVTTPLDPDATTQVTVPWTPATGGVFQIYAKVVAAGDGNAANDATGTKEVYILDETMDVVAVGDDATTTSGYYLPLDMYHKNSVTEELYFTDETHLQSGTITAVVYKNTFLTNLPDKPVKIWMAHTAVSDLTGGWLPAEAYSLVFDGTVDFPSGVNYIVIPLDTPFAYTGGTLATRVNRPMDTAYFSSSDKFFYTTTAAHTNRSRYLVSDSVTYDPMAPSAAGTAVGYVPNTMLIVQNAVMQTAAIMQGHVYEAGGTNPVAGATVTLTDERYSTTTNAEGYYEFNFWETHTVTATASKATYYSQTVNGIALTMGNTVTQNFSLQPMPRVTVSGIVTANDYPAGLAGATIELSGTENYSVSSQANGTFSIANVLGSSAGIAYTVTVSKDGYQSYSGSATVYETALSLGSINLIEYLWTPYHLVATHEGENARLNWDPAAEPEYLFFDFEADNGGWVGSGYGDWEWSNTYDVANFVYTYTGTNVTPPPAAHSGDGMWGTKMLTNYNNSGAFSYLTQTIDLAGFDSPQLRFWSWENVFGSYDYCQVAVNGTVVWGPSWQYTGTAWTERVISLAAYANQTVTIQFQFYATTTVNYAGWYIDDVYIGPAPTREISAQIGSSNGTRSLLNYDVYRRNPGAAWTLLNDAVTETTYLDTGFASVPGGVYEWGVKANYSGGLESAEIVSNTLGRVYQPTDIAVQRVAGNVLLSWTAEPGAAYYKVYASTDPYGVFSYLGHSATPSFTVVSPTEPYKFYYVTAVADEALPARENMITK